MALADVSDGLHNGETESEPKFLQGSISQTYLAGGGILWEVVLMSPRDSTTTHNRVQLTLCGQFSDRLKTDCEDLMRGYLQRSMTACSSKFPRTNLMPQLELFEL